ncbi:MAG: hypothetical protein NHB32_29290 [Fischerella sp. CENA71]|nr:hypothetical protein [Fischerella sp. CENA71]
MTRRIFALNSPMSSLSTPRATTRETRAAVAPLVLLVSRVPGQSQRELLNIQNG